MFSSRALGWLEPFLQLIMPEKCRVCGCEQAERRQSGICPDCLAAVAYMGKGCCKVCGCLLPSGHAAGCLCGSCLKKPPPWDTAISVVRYGPEVRYLLSRLKYQADTTVLPALKTIARPVVEQSDQAWDLVLPVPLHTSRLRRRGMNQALHLAQLFFPDRKQAILPQLLVRRRRTAPQTGLDGTARRRNLRGAFHLTDPGAVVDARVCIVDDVFTTGTTVAECSRVVRRAGAKEIGVVTMARVVMGR